MWQIILGFCLKKTMVYDIFPDLVDSAHRELTNFRSLITAQGEFAACNGGTLRDRLTSRLRRTYYTSKGLYCTCLVEQLTFNEQSSFTSPSETWTLSSWKQMRTLWRCFQIVVNYKPVCMNSYCLTDFPYTKHWFMQNWLNPFPKLLNLKCFTWMKIACMSNEKFSSRSSLRVKQFEINQSL